MFKRQFVWIAAVILVVAWVVVYRPLAAETIEVETALVEKGDLVSDFSAEGFVKARTVKLAPRSTGRVVAILLNEGDRAKKGDAIARLYDADLASQRRIAATEVSIATKAHEGAMDALASSIKALDAERKSAIAAKQSAEARLARLLAGTRPEEIAMAEQQASIAKAQYETTQSAFERVQRLHREGAVSDAEFEQARLVHSTAEMNLKSAEERVRLLKAGATKEEIEGAEADLRATEAGLQGVKAKQEQLLAQGHDVEAAEKAVAVARQRLKATDIALSDMVITAPFDGRMANLLVEVGDIVSTFNPLATFVDDSSLEIEAEIGDQDAAIVVPHMAVTVTTASFPGRKFAGSVMRTAVEAEQKPNTLIRTRIVRATIKVQDAGGALIAGMEVSIKGAGTLVKDCVMVPSDAILTDSSGQSVWVLTDSRVQERAVQTGAVTYARTQVLSGVAVGETVVTSSKNALVPGLKVDVLGK